MVNKLDLQLRMGKNERRKTVYVPRTGGVSAVRISDRPKVEPVCSPLFGHFPSKLNISWRGLLAYLPLVGEQSAVAVRAKGAALDKNSRGTGNRSPPPHLLMSVLGVRECCSGHFNVFR